jgi:ABC-type branched-subunit amino acid transport system substrate-binding protein
MLQISPNAGAAELSTAEPAHDRYFFRTIMTNGNSAAMVHHARVDAIPNCGRIALVHDPTVTGIAYRDAVKDLFARMGGCTAVDIEIPSVKQVDYSAWIDALFASSAECGLIASPPPSSAEFLRQIRIRLAGTPTPDPRWAQFPWYGEQDLYSDAMITQGQRHPPNATPNDAEGLIVAVVDPSPSTREFFAFHEYYTSSLGKDPSEAVPAFVAQGYDATVLAALAIERAGTLSDRVAIRDGLWAVVGVGADHATFGPTELSDALTTLRLGHEIHYSGASSKLVFDDYGTVLSQPYALFKIVQGAYASLVQYADDAILQTTTLPPASVTDCH